MVTYVKEIPDFPGAIHECKCHHDDCAPNQEYVLDTRYCHLQKKIAKHINNSDIHVSEEDRKAWNAAAKQTSSDEVKEQLIEVINTEIQKIQAELDDYQFKADMNKYYTAEQIDNIIANLEIPTGNFVTTDQLEARYKELVALYESIKSTMVNYYTKDEVDNKTNYAVNDFSISGNTITLDQNNVGKFTVNIPTSSSSTTSGMSKDEADGYYIKKNTLKNLTIRKADGSSEVYNPESNSAVINLTSSGSSSTAGKNGGLYKPYFQNSTSSTKAPQLPDSGKAPEDCVGTEKKAWTEYSVNRKTGEYTWMTQVFIDGDGKYGVWLSAVCITGDQGSAGEDGTDREFIYVRSKTSVKPDAPTVSKNEDGYIPDQWSDNPSGVDSEYAYEWMCLRVKENNTWGKWIGPILWSHYGHNGTDGDGVEYIFSVSTDYPTVNPSAWYSDAQSKADTKKESFNKDEYIPDQYKAVWFDDPQELVTEGQKAWVSIRKKRSDTTGSSESGDAYWHQYSNPTLWAYYPYNGAAGDAIRLALDNTTMAVNTNSDGKCVAYTGETGIHFYNGVSDVTQDLTMEIESITRSDGQTVSDASWVTVDKDANKVIVTLTEGQLYLEGLTYTISIKASATTGGTTGVTRKTQLQVVGVRIGEDGASYSLKLSSAIIKYSDGVKYPDTISVSCIKVLGMSFTEIKPSAAQGFTFQCNYDDADTWTDIASDQISSSDISDHATVRLMYNTSLVDQQTIYVVKDGTPGTSGISYSIDVSQDSVTVTDGKANGVIKFCVHKRTSILDVMLPDTTGVNCYVGSSTSKSVSADWNIDDYTYTVSFSDYDVSDASYYLFIQAHNSRTSEFLASTVVPFIVPGPSVQGESSVRLDLSNECSSVTCDKDGNVLGTVQGTTATLYYGKNAVSGSNMYQIASQSGFSTECTMNPITGVLTVGTIKNGKDTLEATVKIIAVYAGYSYYATYTITKVLAGDDGTPATTYWLVPSCSVIKVDSSGNVTPSTISCKAMMQTGSGDAKECTKSIYYKTSKQTNYALASIITIPVDSSVESYTFILSDGSPVYASSKIYDTETIPVVRDGQNASSTVQTLKGSPLRLRGNYSDITAVEDGEEWKFFDGKRAAASDGVLYQDVVLYSNTYYVCINSETGKADNWATAPDSASYWSPISIGEDEFKNLLIANKAYIKELSSEEIVIMDDDKIVAGMTSGKAISDSSDLNGKVTDKGDVRIWAGEMQTSGNLATAPFTVTSNGVVTSGGDDAQIRIENGRIYFTINGNTWWLGIGDDGKPNWLGGSGAADKVVTYYTLEKSGNYVVSKAVETQLGVKDDKWYTDATLANLCNGTYYVYKKSYRNVVYDCSNKQVLVSAGTIDAQFYKKLVITNGVAQDAGTVAIAKDLSIASTGTNMTFNVGTDFQWCTITKKSLSSADWAIIQSLPSNNTVTGSTIAASRVTLPDDVYVLKTTTSESINTDGKFSHWMMEASPVDGNGNYIIITSSLW